MSGPPEGADAGLEAAVVAAPGGVTLLVRAQPGARRNAITGVRNGELLVAVTAPPDKGRANDAIVALLAETLSVAKGRVELLSGGSGRHKRFSVAGVRREAVLAALRPMTA